MKSAHILRFTGAKRLCIALLVFACGFSTVVRAQQSPAFTPRFEASADYSFIRANAGNSNGGFNLNGGSGSFAYNFTDRFSVLADFGAYRFSGLPVGLNSTMYTYLFGPRISLRKSGHVTPFGHLLLGGSRLNASSGSVDAGENGFAMAAGGGVDIGFRSHMAIRLIQAEYLLTRFPSVNGVSAEQNDMRLSAGIVFRFGSH